MLSVFRIQNEKYYTALAHTGYMEEGGESPGVWYGKGAAALDLNGIVDANHLSTLLEGYCPNDSGKQLQNAGKHTQLYRKDGQLKERHREVGMDATFSAPKSVSVVWALGDEGTRKVIQTAHDQAVKKALDIFEENYAYTRRGKGGKQVEKTRIVAALFRHVTSRFVEGIAPDPQLHTHALIAKASVREDGAFRSLLFSRYPRGRGQPSLLEVQKTLGAIYRLELAHALQMQLGYNVAITPSADGKDMFFELIDVEPTLCQVFSKRRRKIEAELSKPEYASDESPALKASIIAVKTRGLKGVVPPRKELYKCWEQIGQAHGYRSPPAVFRIPSQTAAFIQIEQRMHEFMTAHESFAKHELVRHVAIHAVGTGLNYDAVTRLVDDRLTREDVISRGQQDQVETSYSLRSVLHVEQDLIKTLLKLNVYGTQYTSNDGVPWKVDDGGKQLERRKDSDQPVGQETGRDIHIIAIGKKARPSSVIKAAQPEWQKQEKIPVGVAPGKHSYRMEQETGIKTSPPEWFTFNYGSGNQSLDPKTVVIVSQPQSIKKQTLLDIVTIARNSNVPVVMLGSGRFSRSLMNALERERVRQQQELIADVVAQTNRNYQSQLEL